MDYLQYTKTSSDVRSNKYDFVLNLIINGLPSIRLDTIMSSLFNLHVLNLIINGLPSILRKKKQELKKLFVIVLNLIINGLPSIP